MSNATHRNPRVPLLVWPGGMASPEGHVIGEKNIQWSDQQVEIARALDNGVREICGHRQSGKTTAVLAWLYRRSLEQYGAQGVMSVGIVGDVHMMTHLACRIPKLASIELLLGRRSINAWMSAGRGGPWRSPDIIVYEDMAGLAPDDKDARRIEVHTGPPLGGNAFMTRWWEDPGCTWDGFSGRESATEALHAVGDAANEAGVVLDEGHTNFAAWALQAMFCGDAAVFLQRYPFGPALVDA